MKLFGRTEKAVTETIRICKDQNVLKDYLAKEEVSAVMFGYLDKEKLIEISNRKMREEVIAEGRAEGQKSMARILFNSGVSLETIALSAGVSVDQIKRWLADTEPEPLAG